MGSVWRIDLGDAEDVDAIFPGGSSAFMSSSTQRSGRICARARKILRTGQATICQVGLAEVAENPTVKDVSHENALHQRAGVEQRENHAQYAMYSGERIGPYSSMAAATGDLDGIDAGRRASARNVWIAEERQLGETRSVARLASLCRDSTLDGQASQWRRTLQSNPSPQSIKVPRPTA